MLYSCEQMAKWLTNWKASVKQALDQMNLLSGVRNDIEYDTWNPFLLVITLTATL